MMGGGGGGRDTMAQAGGKDAEKLDEALATARRAIEAKLGVAGLTPRPRARLRQCALRLRDQRPDRHPRDAARPVATPAREPGLSAIARLVAEQRRRRGRWSGCRVSLSGEEGPRPRRRASSPPGCRAASASRSRPGTSASRPRLAQAHSGPSSEDSRAAAHLLAELSRGADGERARAAARGACRGRACGAASSAGAVPAVRGRRRRRRCACTIPKAGRGGGDRATSSTERGVVPSATLFELRATLGRRPRRPEARALRAAQGHVLRRRARPPACRARRSEIIQLTIPEGLSRREVAPLAARAGVRGDYLRASAATSLIATAQVRAPQRPPRASRASCSRPPTSCAAGRRPPTLVRRAARRLRATTSRASTSPTRAART